MYVFIYIYIYVQAGCATRADFEELYGDDLFIDQAEEYDRVAKVCV